MNSFQEIIDAWPSVAALAQDLETSDSHVRTMRTRNSIAARFWTRLDAAARKRGIAGVTLERLAELAALNDDAAGAASEAAA